MILQGPQGYIDVKMSAMKRIGIIKGRVIMTEGDK